MKVVHANLWLCADCMSAAVNDDYSPIDYSYSGTEADERVSAIKAGLIKLGPGLVPDFDSETGEGCSDFSARPCACCGTHAAGARQRFAVLGDEGARKCEVQWIDCNDRPTPDTNDATAYAVLRGTSVRYLVCDEHAAVIRDNRCHFGACRHATDDESSWDLIPLESEPEHA